MGIPREVIDAVKDRTDIVDLIGSYVTLKRAGSVYNGLCPFHSEKTPSFTVFPDTQSFFCFGCEAGGDVFTFIMLHENLDYLDAVGFLAKRCGITIPEDDPDPGMHRGVSRKRVYEMNLIAARFFRDCLFHPDTGRKAMAYLTEKRGLSVPFIRRFGIGYAPDDFGALTTVLRKAGYTNEEMKTAFLCGISQKSGHVYDYFRNRVMFPVMDNTGHVIAFSGRDLGGDSHAKYLNSSDTPAFQKRKNLFALNFARNHCAEQMILCEGNMDVVSLHAAGFENAVASLGTALTDEQVRIMARYTKQVIIAYDADAAGQKAAHRAMDMFAKVGLDVRILSMDGAKDPDEYIKTFGADAFATLLKKSYTGFEFNFRTVLAAHDISQPDGKIQAASELCRIISRVYASSERDVYIHAVADRLELREDSLRNDVERLIRMHRRENHKEERRQAQISAMALKDTVNPEAAGHIQAAAAEETIIGLLLLYEEHREAVRTGQVPVTADSFVTDFHKRAFERIMDLQSSDGGFSFALLGETFTPEEMGRLARMEQKRRSLAENGTAVLRAAGDTLMREKQELSTADSPPIEGIRWILEQKRREIHKP